MSKLRGPGAVAVRSRRRMRGCIGLPSTVSPSCSRRGRRDESSFEIVEETVILALFDNVVDDAVDVLAKSEVVKKFIL